MPVLNPNEYDASYFDGALQPLKHNAGYSYYERWYRYDGVNSLGEFYKDKAAMLKNKFGLTGKVLEVGCAKGFVVDDLRSMGVDAWGIDVSPYAISQASPAVAPYLTVGDARTALASYSNKTFTWLFSLRFMECIADTDIPALVTEMNRISQNQFHYIDEFTGEKIGTYYNVKLTNDWVKYSWQKKTSIISEENQQKELIK